MIWATRGKSWGFRFLQKGGLRDPLATYETAFQALEGQREGVARTGEHVALRFADPEGRTDRAGRIIPHDFVLMGDLAARVESVEDGLTHVWPLVAGRYAEIWELPKPASRD